MSSGEPNRNESDRAQESDPFDPSRPYCAADYLGPEFIAQRFVPVSFDERNAPVMMPVDELGVGGDDRFIESASNAYASYSFVQETLNPAFIQGLAEDFSKDATLPKLIASLVVPYVALIYVHGLQDAIEEKGIDAISPNAPHLKVTTPGDGSDSDVRVTIDVGDDFAEKAAAHFASILDAGFSRRDGETRDFWFVYAEWIWVNLIGSHIQRLEEELGDDAVGRMSEVEVNAAALKRFQSDEAGGIQMADLMMSYAQMMAGVVVKALNVRLMSLQDLEALLGLRAASQEAPADRSAWSSSAGIIAIDISQLLRCVELDPQELLQLNPRGFEELVADIWKRFGYDVELTKATRDGGRDIVATRHDEARVKVLIECKRYTPPRKVGAPTVQQLYGVLMSEGATKAVLATTSEFTRDANKLADAHQWHIDLRDKIGVLEWLRRASPR